MIVSKIIILIVKRLKNKKKKKEKKKEKENNIDKGKLISFKELMEKDRLKS
jgi:hypothetical protein